MEISVGFALACRQTLKTHVESVYRLGFAVDKKELFMFGYCFVGYGCGGASIGTLEGNPG